MKIVQQSHEWITPLNRDATLPRIEQIARTCYKSEGAIKPGSDAKMVAMLCKNHHYAMIEHISLSMDDFMTFIHEHYKESEQYILHD